MFTKSTAEVTGSRFKTQSVVQAMASEIPPVWPTSIFACRLLSGMKVSIALATESLADANNNYIDFLTINIVSVN